MSDRLIRGIWCLAAAVAAGVVLALGSASDTTSETLLVIARAVLLVGVLAGLWYVVRDLSDRRD